MAVRYQDPVRIVAPGNIGGTEQYPKRQSACRVIRTPDKRDHQSRRLQSLIRAAIYARLRDGHPPPLLLIGLERDARIPQLGILPAIVRDCDGIDAHKTNGNDLERSRLRRPILGDFDVE